MIPICVQAGPEGRDEWLALARLGDVDPADLLDIPYVWFGTVEAIAEQLRRHHQRWGVDRYAVRRAALEPAAEILQILTG